MSGFCLVSGVDVFFKKECKIKKDYRFKIYSLGER